MRVILTADVPGTGRRNQVLTVPDGFARNFLLPHGFAQLATPDVVKRQQQSQQQQIQAQSRQLAERQELAERLRRARVTVAATANEQGRLYGTVSAEQVAAVLQRQGLAVERSWIAWARPIDRLGPTTVTVNLGHNLISTFSLTVIRKADHG